MSLIKIGRTIVRRLWNFPKLIECNTVTRHPTKWLVNVNKSRTRFLWTDLKAFGCNNVAAEFRRQASRQFLRRYATNFCLLSFVSIYLQENEEQCKYASFSTIVEGIRARAQNAIQIQNQRKDYPCQLSGYKIEKRLGERSCHSAVYQADIDGNKCALKIMFNYENSSSDRIYQAFKREYEVLSKGTEKQPLRRHPNIIELLCKFVDKMPELYDSRECYPLALPRQYVPDGCGRTQTLFLVMPKYSCTLREYLQFYSEKLDCNHRINLLQQLLEGVGYLEQNSISHRDLKSDNILIEDFENRSMVPNLVITDFGCCFTGENMVLPFETEYVDKGGNMALMAPEIASAICGKGVYLDYSKSDAWSTGTLAYEIFGHFNPFYTISNRSYTMNDLPALSSGNDIVDHVVYDLLLRDPAERLTARHAATILFVLMNAPREWLRSYGTVTEIDINRWIVELFIMTLRKFVHSGEIVYNETQMLLVFLGRVSVDEVMDAITYIKGA